jgi:hypothetical protein
MLHSRRHGRLSENINFTFRSPSHSLIPSDSANKPFPFFVKLKVISASSSSSTESNNCRINIFTSSFQPRREDFFCLHLRRLVDCRFISHQPSACLLDHFKFIHIFSPLLPRRVYERLSDHMTGWSRVSLGQIAPDCFSPTAMITRKRCTHVHIHDHPWRFE